MKHYKYNIMFKFIKNILTDQNGNESSKRVVIFLAMIQIMIMANRSIFGIQKLMTPEGHFYTQPVTINQDVFWGFFSIVVVGLGMATSEFFAKNKSNSMLK